MEDPCNGFLGVTSGARCSPKAGIHLRPIVGCSCEKAVLMGVLVEAGGGYRAKLFATHPKATKQIRVDTRGRAQRPAHTLSFINDSHSNGLIGVTGGARCSPKAGIHLRPIVGCSCEKAVLMGVLVEAGGGYRAKPFVTHPKATKQIRVDTRGRA
jgi:hypothetical protein